MNKHYVSDTNSVHVTFADNYRVSGFATLTPIHPDFEELQEHISPEHRRPDGYGLAFLESEEHSLMYVGSVEQVEECRTSGAPLDVKVGVSYDKWPHGPAWDKFIPDNTWHQSGEGIVTEFDHPAGGKVVVYEYLAADDNGSKVPMVAFHCDHCHPAEHEQSRANKGPHDRRWTARMARTHIQNVERHGVGTQSSACRPTNPLWSEIAQKVANDYYGVNHPTTSWESHCATDGPCSVIRELRAGIRPAAV